MAGYQLQGKLCDRIAKLFLKLARTEGPTGRPETAKMQLRPLPSLYPNPVLPQPKP